MGTRSHPVYTGCRGNYITRGRAQRRSEDVGFAVFLCRAAPQETEAARRLLGGRINLEAIVDADAIDDDVAFSLLICPSLTPECDHRRPAHQQQIGRAHV